MMTTSGRITYDETVVMLWKALSEKYPNKKVKSIKPKWKSVLSLNAFADYETQWAFDGFTVEFEE